MDSMLTTIVVIFVFAIAFFVYFQKKQQYETWVDKEVPCPGNNSTCELHPGGLWVDSEAECREQCDSIAGCNGYQFWRDTKSPASGNNCWPKRIVPFDISTAKDNKGWTMGHKDTPTPA